MGLYDSRMFNLFARSYVSTLGIIYLSRIEDKTGVFWINPLMGKVYNTLSKSHKPDITGSNNLIIHRNR